MKTALQFDFSIDKENKTINVTRAFDANVDLVWDAWTKPELLDQWWAPKPWRAQTKSMDFREGGTWIYAMIGPEGEAHWSRDDFKHVDPKKSFGGQDAFCDENGNINPDMPRMYWTNQFNDLDGQTRIDIDIRFDALSDLENIIEMGFREGFTACLGNLDELLEKLKSE